MITASCPQCLVEQRADRVRLVMNVAAGLAVLAVAVPCCFAGVMFRGVEGESRLPPMWVLLWAEVGVAWLYPLALAAACLVIGLHVVARQLTRRASAPLPPPPTDPLAHYREGALVECPRHPFAR